MELHGGTIRADSAGEGKGATFIASLPASSAAVDSPSALSEGGQEAYPPVSLERVRVLVVEDEPDTQEFLKRLLEDHGATVLVAASAHDAMRMAREQPPDILISDIGLPDIDGYELIQRIRDENPRSTGMPAIALTAYARAEDRARALRAGYQAHLAKPVEPSDLLMIAASFAEMMRASRPA
jgi:CheY-like chemotaxis protein